MCAHHPVINTQNKRVRIHLMAQEESPGRLRGASAPRLLARRPSPPSMVAPGDRVVVSGRLGDAQAFFEGVVLWIGDAGERVRVLVASGGSAAEPCVVDVLAGAVSSVAPEGVTPVTLPSELEAAWQDYLAGDASDQWADAVEAPAAEPPQAGTSSFDGEQLASSVGMLAGGLAAVQAQMAAMAEGAAQQNQLMKQLSAVVLELKSESAVQAVTPHFAGSNVMAPPPADTKKKKKKAVLVPGSGLENLLEFYGGENGEAAAEDSSDEEGVGETEASFAQKLSMSRSGTRRRRAGRQRQGAS